MQMQSRTVRQTPLSYSQTQSQHSFESRTTQNKKMSLETFIDYLQQRNLSPSTQKHYCRYVHNFATWYKHDLLNCSKRDILSYLEHLQTKLHQANITRRNTLIALNHYFSFLLADNLIPTNPTSLLKIRGAKRKTLHNVLTQEQLHALYDNYYLLFIQNFDNSTMPANTRVYNELARQRSFVVLGLLVYQGINTSDTQNINIGDLDLIKGTIKIQATLKSSERLLPLHASQIGALMNYLQNIRPQFFEHCKQSDKLFIALPECGKTKATTDNAMRCYKTLTQQVKTLDKSFVNFKQVRASVIAHWLKTQGLRKAQYLAGHRYISSTEKYLPNNLDGLIDDITKFNPF
jgi:site-specific recombinase XerD